MRISQEIRPLDNLAPNAILDRMRRRIAHVGLLVALLSTALTALAAFLIYACVYLL